MPPHIKGGGEGVGLRSGDGNGGSVVGSDESGIGVAVIGAKSSEELAGIATEEKRGKGVATMGENGDSETDMDEDVADVVEADVAEVDDESSGLQLLESGILLQSLLQTCAPPEVGKTLVSKWWIKQEVTQASDTSAGNKSESC